MLRFAPTSTAVILLVGLAAGSAAAQAAAPEQMDMAMTGDQLVAGRHMLMTPAWPLQPGDQARADSLVAIARVALAQFADVSVAEAAGYRMFAPAVKRQKVYHYTNRMHAVKARWTFDPTEPTSLLYQPQPDGSLKLIGAMYTAPPGFSLEQLNARIPLSVAQWHQHTSICLPPGADPRAGVATRDPRFGPRGSISTEAACTAAGGTFKQRMAGWMVHVNMFEPRDQVWEHRH
jgi:hypothetical protein